MSARRRAPTVFEVPEPTPELAEQLEQVGRFFLDLRGAGHFLAPEDSQWLLSWLAAGAAPDQVMRGMHRGAQRVLKDKQVVRNVSRLARSVEGELKKARGKGGGRRARPPGQDVLERWRSWREGEHAALAALGSQVEGDAELDALLRPVRVAINEAPPTEESLPMLMAEGRRLYEGLLGLLDEEERASLRSQATATLEAWIWPMSPEAREETVAETVVQLLRERIGVLRPEALFELWEDR